MKRLLPIVAYVLTPLLLLLLTEGIVRVGAPADLRLQTIDRTLIDERDGQFPYVNRAHFTGQVRQRTVQINAHHLRSPALQHDGRPRLLLLGDSILFGLGLSDEEAATAVLEAALDEQVQVLNSATIGYATAHQRAFLETFGETLAPNAVVLGYCLNDPWPANNPTLTTHVDENAWPGLLAQVNRWLQGRSYLFIWLKGLLHIERRQYGYPVHMRPLFEDPYWSANQEHLDAIAAWCKARGLPFGVVLFPHRDQLIPSMATDDVPQRLLTTWATTTEVPILDLQGVLHADDYLYGDPIHLDANGMAHSMHAFNTFYRQQLTTNL